MLFVDLLQWWYSTGWLRQLKAIGVNALNWFEYFSVPTLLKTLFSPWKQIISTPKKDQSLNDKFSGLLDNLISRFVGFMVRTIALITAVVIAILSVVVGVIIFLIWPLVPLAPLLFTFIGVSAL